MKSPRALSVKAIGLMFGFMWASIALDARAEIPSEDWYQIEIIVFTPMNPGESAESWPEATNGYPGTMIAIAPRSDDARTPPTLAELVQLLSDDPEGAESIPANTPETGFLFENRSRASRQAVIAATNVAPETTPDETTEELPLEDYFNTGATRPFRELPVADRLMGDIAGSLRRSSSYRLLLHSSWVQPVPDREQAWPVLVQAGDRFGDLFEIDGTISIGRSRYLHADLDLVYTWFAQLTDENLPVPEIVASLAPETRREFADLVNAETARFRVAPGESHVLRDSRRMRSGTTHYIDHPDFGIIIQTERFDPETPAPGS